MMLMYLLQMQCIQIQNKLKNLLEEQELIH